MHAKRSGICRFAFRAVARHLGKSAAVFMFVALAAIAGARLMPPSFEIPAKPAATIDPPSVADRVADSSRDHDAAAEQCRQLLAAWQQASGRLRTVKDELEGMPIESRRRELQDQLADVESRLLACGAELQASEAQIASLERQIASLPAKVLVRRPKQTGAGANSFPAALQALLDRERELAAKVQDSHPQLVAVRQEIADLRAKLDEQPVDLGTEDREASEAPNPARQALEQELGTEQAQGQSLRQRERLLLAQQEQLRQDMDQLDADAATIARLEQQAELAEADYRQSVERLELARMHDAVGEHQPGNGMPAQPVIEASRLLESPSPAVVLAAGLLLAAICGLATALLSARLNPLIAQPEDLADLLGLPVIGVLPR